MVHSRLPRTSAPAVHIPPPPPATNSHAHPYTHMHKYQVRGGTLYVNGLPRTEPFIFERPGYTLSRLVVPQGDVSAGATPECVRGESRGGEGRGGEGA
jgi:hypothetical protein